MKETPISSLHRQLGARMDEEDGWQMPLQFHSLIEEHLAMRSACGIFDISHLAKLRITGNGALDWLESLLTNNIGSCQDGHAQRTLMLRENGTIIDKPTLLRESAGRFLLLGHAALAQEDFLWLQGHLPHGGIAVEDETERWSGMALYGPASESVFARVLPGEELPPPMAFHRLEHPDGAVLLTRLALQGDDGFELFCPANRGIAWFESFISAGAVPCGTTTREHTRLARACTCCQRDLQGLTPHEASLGSLCAREKTYIGSDTVARQEQSPCEMKLVPLHCTEESDTPGPGTPVVDAAGVVVGHVTSACTCPHHGRALAIASLPTHCATPGTRLRLLLHNTTIPALVGEQEVR